MLADFLTANASELVARCQAKVLDRPAPRVTDVELEHGVPMFLGQLIEALNTHKHKAPPPMVSSAHLHGSEMQRMGFTVEQVVHDYGDLCQAITELAVEKNSGIDAEEFGMLNRCLDDAIAGAVSEYVRPLEAPDEERDRETPLATPEDAPPDASVEADADDTIAEEVARLIGERSDRREAGKVPRRAESEIAAETHRLVGSAAFELHALLKAAVLSFDAIKRGRVAVNGSTGAVHDQSLRGLRRVIDRSLLQLRLTAGMRMQSIDVAQLVAEADTSATLDALGYGVRLTVIPVADSLTVHADRTVLVTVLAHLLQNAIKHTHENGRHTVTLRARSVAGQVRIDVEDECGGLAPGAAENLFWPFAASNRGRVQPGELGLAICRRAIEANGGTLLAQNRPSLGGCVFTVGLAAQQAPVGPGDPPPAALNPPTHQQATTSPSRLRTNPRD